jgi:hypothetical protein
MKQSARVTVLASLALAVLPGTVAAHSEPSALPRPFCPQMAAITHDPRADITGTQTDTLARVRRVQARYVWRLFHRCRGVVLVGAEPATGPTPSPPPHEWVLGIAVLTHDLPAAKAPPAFLEGVRIRLRPIGRRPKTMPLPQKR